MGIKSAVKTGAVKTLQKISDGLKWAQEHPVALERTVLVVGTLFATRLAFKRFAPASSGYVKYINNAAPKGMNILKSIDPPYYDDADVSEVFHLEINDQDLLDIHYGSGLMYNIKNQVGRPNYPVAIIGYEGLMKSLNNWGVDFPKHALAEQLLSENEAVNSIAS